MRKVTYDNGTTMTTSYKTAVENGIQQCVKLVEVEPEPTPMHPLAKARRKKCVIK